MRNHCGRSNVGVCMIIRALLPALLALAGLPAAATAAAVPDRVVDEVSSLMDVGIDGTVVAYTHRIGTRGVEVVVRDGDRPVVRLAAGRGESPVGVGKDRSGKRVVVYLRCGVRCDLVAYSPSAGKSRVVDKGFADATDLAVGKGRVFWIDGRRVYSRPLTQGRVRREALVAHMDPSSLDSDGTTLAVVGDLPGEFAGGATGVSVTRPGSGRARLRAERTYSEEYAGFRDPVVTAKGVTTLFDHFTFSTSIAFAELAAGDKGWKARGTGAMQILRWDADGSHAVFVEAPSDVGCGLGSDFLEQIIASAPCRIVLADLSRERILPPRISIRKNVATVVRTKVRGSRITGRIPEVGVKVEVRDSDKKLVATLTTDAQGKVALPEPDAGGIAVTAATLPVSYAYDSGN
jgi:hypothetical protein